MSSFLFVQTAFNYHDVAVIDNSKIVKSWHISESRQTLKFLIQTLQQLHGFPFNYIVFVQGPGSFTSLRVGATWINTLAYTRNVPIKNISTLSYVSLFLGKAEKDFTITFDDKRYFSLSGDKMVVGDTPDSLFVYNPETSKVELTEAIAKKLTGFSYSEPVMSTDVLYVIPPKITLSKSST